MAGESGESGGSGGGGLPGDIIQSIAIANAKSIGEQPAILANLALANQILNNNLAQQINISNQQAMNQLAMATMAKAVSLITSLDAEKTSVVEIERLFQLLKEMQPSK